MNPAFSVILLTTASGAGYGLLAWLGVMNALRLLPASPVFGVLAILVALALSAIGLLASTFHLGHPERAWRAISQWRSSWLSREGVLALFTNLPALGFAAAWWFAGRSVGVTVVLGLLAAASGLATVGAQAMIYATLKPIRQWCNDLVLPNLLLLSLYSGAAWLAAATALLNQDAARLSAVVAAVFAVGGLVVKLAYWRQIDASAPVATIESATGLGWLGPVRSLEAPHTEENYLLREMGYVIARRHASRLRGVAMAAGFIVPSVLLVVGAAVGGSVATVLLCVSAILVILGIYIERWLFFAEATHTVTLYYGR
ncbi:MAG TPA: DmsC/YnfH family molybdoenzyme membrane anchor subunit [Acetobacteraceae bacterium]|jgi:DMSO reductase anchor subunit